MQTAIETIRQKGLLGAYDKACKNDNESNKMLASATEAYSSYQCIDENPPEKKVLIKATDAKSCTSKAIAPAINHMFILYSNLLMEEARQAWTKIVKEQINSEPWAYLYGVDHPKKHAES